MHTQAQTLMNNSNISKSTDNLRGAVGDTGNSVMREVEIFRTGAHPNHRVNGVGIRANSVRSQQTQVGAANLTEWSPIRIQNYRTQTNTNTPIRSWYTPVQCSKHPCCRNVFPSMHDLTCNSYHIQPQPHRHHWHDILTKGNWKSIPPNDQSTLSEQTTGYNQREQLQWENYWGKPGYTWVNFQLACTGTKNHDLYWTE